MRVVALNAEIQVAERVVTLHKARPIIESVELALTRITLQVAASIKRRVVNSVAPFGDQPRV